ncbi:diguanylate cyclase, partial [Myxococcus xanthus]
LPDTPLAVARERAETLRRAFEALRVRHGPGSLSATLSCGVAAFPEHAGQPFALLACADEALYDAKVRGRNRVAVHGTAGGRQSTA